MATTQFSKACILFSTLLLLSVKFIFGDALPLSVMDFGAIPDNPTNEACYINAAAIEKALLSANDTSAPSRTVLIPGDIVLHIFRVNVRELYNVTFQIEGSLVVSNNITEWVDGITDYTAALEFSECRVLNLVGRGSIDGQGYNWWWHAILTKPGHRPHMLWIFGSEDVHVYDLHFKNSPNFHCRIYDVHRLHVRNIDIWVDVVMQQALQRQHNHWLEYPVVHSAGAVVTPMPLDALPGIPTFPLNTDGIDINGYEILIEDSTIQNYDDAVVVKPNDVTSYWGPCAHDVLVRNMTVYFGVGMSIGSIGPGETHPCIRNVTFEDITFNHPLKAVYIKTNPGDSGDGSVSDITYRNLVVKNALWYPIWIGPQQMQEPGEEGTGCSFLYPLAGACPTQPRINITNVLLQNITSTGGLFLPGVLLGDAANPLKQLSLRDVRNSGPFLVQPSYVCAGVEQGSSSAEDSVPAPGCF